MVTMPLYSEAGAAVTVRTYWAWETTATLRLLGGARGAGAPTGVGEGRGHIVSPRAHSLFLFYLIFITTFYYYFYCIFKNFQSYIYCTAFYANKLRYNCGPHHYYNQTSKVNSAVLY